MSRIAFAKPQSLALAVIVLALVCIVGCFTQQYYVDDQLSQLAPKFGKPGCQPIPVTMEVVCQMNGEPNPKMEETIRPKIVRILRSSGTFAEADTPSDAWGGHVRVTVNEKNTLQDKAFNASRSFLVGLTYGLVGQNLDGEVEMTFVHTPPSGEAITKTFNHKYYVGVGWRLGPPDSTREVTAGELMDQVLEDATRNFSADQTLLAQVNATSTNTAIAKRLPQSDITPVVADQPATSTTQPVETAHLPLPTPEPIVR